MVFSNWRILSFVCAIVSIHNGFAAPLSIQHVYTGADFTCAISTNGSLKCWGANASGQLGLGDTRPRGVLPTDMGMNLPSVNLGGAAVQSLSIGYDASVCALLSNGMIKCWGDNTFGQLGYEDTLRRGSRTETTPQFLPAVNLGVQESVTKLASGRAFRCALFQSGRLKCWGKNNLGQLGLNTTAIFGNRTGTMGTALPYVATKNNLAVRDVVTGTEHVCVLLSSNEIQCWGSQASGRLGNAGTQPLGDGANEVPAALQSVNLGLPTGTTAMSLVAGASHTCAVLSDENIKCWGFNETGALGLGDIRSRGTDMAQMGTTLPFIFQGELGFLLETLTAGDENTCAVLLNRGLKCWGKNSDGSLGYGDLNNRGDDPSRTGDLLTYISLGRRMGVAEVSRRSTHTCALMTNNQVKCWGSNMSGQLGLGHVVMRGGPQDRMGDTLSFVDLGEE